METRREAFLRRVGDQPERRTIITELRASGDDSTPKVITGHGAVFDQEAEIWDGIFEVVRAGAFSKTIQEADVRALKNHNPDYILGRNRAGTLRLSQDEIGLAYEIDVDPRVSYANDLHSSIMRGDITQSSYAFLPVQQRWTDREDGTSLRELLEVKLFDVSPVTYPAFVGADASARSALAASGINPDELARITFEHQRGTPLTRSDHAMLKAAIEVFSAMLPTPEPAESHSEGAPVDRAGALTLRRARLQVFLKN